AAPARPAANPGVTPGGGGAAATGSPAGTTPIGFAPGGGVAAGAVPGSAANQESSSSGSTSFREAKERVVEAFERDFLLRALQRHGGNITKAAEEVGMYRQNLQQKMRELGITVEDTVKHGAE
ncbi:MAG TPA: helix-turn-helix domain-containing protein, partial [Candidatus Bathyarchaeia archaeon]|nr:helix-turn-helix domain-containing protein [Candidatus Bathyarchaeia archaeon]